MIREFIKYYKPHWKLFAMDMLCAFAVAGCDLFYPMITRNMINDYIPNLKLRLLMTWAVVLLAIYLLKMGLNYFIQYYGHVVGVRMQARMRQDVFEHLQDLPFSFFDNNKTGTMMSRIINDLMDVSELAHHGPEDLFVSLAMLVGSFIIMCTINVPLTLILFAFLPFLVLFSLKKRIKMSDAFTKTRVEVAEVNATLENSISGIRITKAFTNSEKEIDKFSQNNKRFVAAREYAYQTMAEFHSGMNFILDLMNVVVLVAGGLFTYYGQINFGDFAAYLLFVNMFLGPVKKLVALVEQYQSGMTGFKRFKELLAEKIEPDDGNAQVLQNVKGHVQFCDVSFNYDTEQEVLNHINLDIPAGKTVALVGPSGGGKTTICHLLPRFYEVTSGKILIDGEDIRSFTRRSLRESVGIVQQVTFLFTGTVYENIAYGNLGATFEEVVEAAKKANIHDYILSLPNGYDTYVGERGVKLSGGQKQRISIARVFLKNPPILILDEATSALDNVTEALIQQSLRDLCVGRTTLVVAHRLSTVKNANEIVVIDREGIQEQGTHQELLEKNGIYASLYAHQFSDSEKALLG